MPPTPPRGIFDRRRADLVEVIDLLREDSSVAREFEGVSYGASDLPRLYTLAELLAVKAAIEAISLGAQSYEVEGLVFTRATLFQLQAREESLEAKLSRRRRGGIGLRYGVVR